MTDDAPPADAGEAFDPTQDRYRTLKDVLGELADDPDIPDEPIDRLEVHCLANGEATYRWWFARAEEPEGGVLPPPSSG